MVSNFVVFRYLGCNLTPDHLLASTGRFAERGGSYTVVPPSIAGPIPSRLQLTPNHTEQVDTS